MCESDNYDCKTNQLDDDNSFTIGNPSMDNLIIWNISKVLLRNPNMDLEAALKETQEHLNRDPVEAVVTLPSSQRHLTCALLAWQQLGHDKAESLYRFVSSKLTKEESSSGLQPCRGSFITYNNGSSTEASGPVLKLPIEPRVVMRMEPTIVQRSLQPAPQVKKSKKPHSSHKMCTKDSICLENSCVSRLMTLDKRTKELHERIGKLAKREADRIELLERAEIAWQELEAGYQRRLNATIEKEEDIAREGEKAMLERNKNKDCCMTLVETLKQAGKSVEEVGKKLDAIEKEVCTLAVERMKLNEELKREELNLAASQNNAAQEDRDLKFQLEQKRRQQQMMMNELESARVLTFETERAKRYDCACIRETSQKVSKQIKKEEEAMKKLTEELQEIETRKSQMCEDLEGCQNMCDANLKALTDQLEEKRKLYKELQEKVIACQCKLPVAAQVEVKRTPSLAALCKCSPEDKALKSCSCTSLRARLLSDLLSDLFSGLQSELSVNSTTMPCQLLKCLEDKHDWGRASVVKSNLHNFFKRLLLGELDIAIANSIEKYHAKWVGRSCADMIKGKPSSGTMNESNGWETRAMKRKAQIMANEIAEKMIEERTEELLIKAKQSYGPPPCSCNPSSPVKIYQFAVEQSSFPSTMKLNDFSEVNTLKSTTIFEDLPEKDVKGKEEVPGMQVGLKPKLEPSTTKRRVGREKRTSNAAIIKLRAEVENLKKDILKKVEADIRLLDKNVENGVQTNSKLVNKISKNKTFNPIKKKEPLIDVPKPAAVAIRKPKKINRQYAVNLCLCSNRKKPPLNKNLKKEPSWRKLSSKDVVVYKTSSGAITNKPPLQYNVISSENVSLRVSLTNPKEVPKEVTQEKDCPTCNSKLRDPSLGKLDNKLSKWKENVNYSSSAVLSGDSNLYDTKMERGVTKIVQHPRLKNTATVNINPDLKERNKIKKTSTNTPFNKPSNIPDCAEDCSQRLCPNTESEYMGAINLEKSIEDICKCSEKGGTCIRDSKKSSMKFKECDCKAKDLQEIVNKVQSAPERKLNKPDTYLEKTERNRLSLVQRCQKISDFKKKTKVNEEKKGKAKTKKSSESPTAIVSEIDTILDAPCILKDNNPIDLKEQIKFLGVTVRNVDEKKGTGFGKAAVKECEETCGFSRNILYRSQISYSNKSVNIKQDSEFKFSAALDEIKALFKTNFQNNPLNVTEDKALNTSSYILKRMENKDCVCCNKKDETNELEVNTFDLLEEHLKKKFAELKMSFPSTYMDPSEEKKEYTTIFNKIKQVINDSTTGITCHCGKEPQNTGSWHRAYSLLQEYLNTKINRIQCECLSQKPGQKSLIPDLTEKVCKLIERDFQRLRELCEKKNKCTSRHKNINQLVFEIPEKDTNSEIKSLQSGTFLSAHNIKNASVQLIIPDQETKSCETMMKGGFQVKTAEAQNSAPSVNKMETLKTVVSQGIDCPYSETLLDSLADYLYHRNNEEIPEKESIPYKGTTLNCTCNRHDSCFCQKSLLKQNDSVIDKLWNSCSYDKNQNNLFSYIMDAINRIQNNNYNDGLEGYEYGILSCDSVNNDVKKPHMTDFGSMISENSDFENIDEMEDILSKKSLDSIRKISKQSLQTDTREIQIMSSLIGSSDSKEPLEWFESSSQTVKSDGSPERKSVRFSADPTKHGGKSEIICESTSTLEELHEKCMCNMVPMCHVKMLVENIETKLAHYDCTCDSLSPKVCPVHSQKYT